MCQKPSTPTRGNFFARKNTYFWTVSLGLSAAAAVFVVSGVLAVHVARPVSALGIRNVRENIRPQIRNIAAPKAIMLTPTM
jgi:hypothetical protein